IHCTTTRTTPGHTRSGFRGGTSFHSLVMLQCYARRVVFVSENCPICFSLSQRCKRRTSLECGNLLPLSHRESRYYCLCNFGFKDALYQSGNKLPHSKEVRLLLGCDKLKHIGHLI